jgi:MFS transporter, AAHS family, benzoate transport protein
VSTTNAATTGGPGQEAQRRRTIGAVVLIGFLGLLLDGYDLVVYGAVVPVFLRDPSQIGELTPALAGALGSYALAGTRSTAAS